ncbi:MAG: hypothetical protein CBD88_00955 [Flavobacteriales bacterium TMED228]|nr:MAG: hypothetical protein CBD88_00955 [Flavobacteriales bacterium TMED228]|tara:strand:- start:5016 stop:5318 length:303 start_codon:yes stop_codon:yes gene_type:complete
MSKYDNIDPNKKASYRQYDFTVYKLTVPLAKKRRITERTTDNKVNPKFRILKARVGASLSKHLSDKDQFLTHGMVQKFISNPVIPKEVMELIDLKITAKK